LPPPAPPASLSLFRSSCREETRLASRGILSQNGPGKFHLICEPRQELSCRGPTGTTRHLAPTTVNRNLAAESSFYESLIITEALTGRDNPIQKVLDPTAARLSWRDTFLGW
jgi:hypothetical protein